MFNHVRIAQAVALIAASALSLGITPALAQKAAAPKAGQYKTEAEAKGHCPGDIVVWVNTSTKIYHYAGHPDYGKTKRGAYICEKEASGGGFRAAKNEKRPA
jgi:hypothetical protein